jgi:hypothetical protein
MERIYSLLFRTPNLEAGEVIAKFPVTPFIHHLLEKSSSFRIVEKRSTDIHSTITVELDLFDEGFNDERIAYVAMG